VAMEIRLNLEILKQSGCEVTELRIMGGGSKSEKLVQLKSDAIGMPVTILDVSEAGCMGVAMLAKAFNDNVDVRSIATLWVKTAVKISPSNQEYYNNKFRQYKSLYLPLRSIYRSF